MRPILSYSHVQSAIWIPRFMNDYVCRKSPIKSSKSLANKGFYNEFALSRYSVLQDVTLVPTIHKGKRKSHNKDIRKRGNRWTVMYVRIYYARGFQYWQVHFWREQRFVVWAPRRLLHSMPNRRGRASHRSVGTATFAVHHGVPGGATSATEIMNTNGDSEE